MFVKDTHAAKFIIGKAQGQKRANGNVVKSCFSQRLSFVTYKMKFLTLMCSVFCGHSSLSLSPSSYSLPSQLSIFPLPQRREKVIQGIGEWACMRCRKGPLILCRTLDERMREEAEIWFLKNSFIPQCTHYMCFNQVLGLGVYRVEYH